MTEIIIQSIVEKLIAIVMSLTTLLSGMSGMVVDGTQKFGTALPVSVSLFESSLATKLSATATSSLTLVSATDKDGNQLSGFICLSVDSETASAEFICGTASSTVVSNLQRGISVTTGTTTVASLQKEHRRGASAKITDYPQLAIMGRMLNGQETIPNKLTYVSIATSTFTDNDIINKRYADDLAYSGVPNAGESTRGIVEIGTKAEIISATSTGSTGAYIVPTIKMVSATTSATTTIVATLPSGKISQGFLDQTQAYTWSGTHSNTATTTLATTTITNLQATSFNVTATTSLKDTTVNGTNLNTLINGATSDATSLHYHTGTCVAGVFTTTTIDGATGTTTITHNLGITPAYMFIDGYSSGYQTSQGFATSTLGQYRSGTQITGGGTEMTSDASGILIFPVLSSADTTVVLRGLTSTTFSLFWTEVTAKTILMRYQVCK